MSSYAATLFTTVMCQEKVKRREQMENEGERLWTTVQRTEHDQMSNCCCFLFIYSLHRCFFPFRNIYSKWWNTCGDCLFLVYSTSLLTDHSADEPKFAPRIFNNIFPLLVYFPVVLTLPVLTQWVLLHVKFHLSIGVWVSQKISSSGLTVWLHGALVPTSSSKNTDGWHRQEVFANTYS